MIHLYILYLPRNVPHTFTLGCTSVHCISFTNNFLPNVYTPTHCPCYNILSACPLLSLTLSTTLSPTTHTHPLTHPLTHSLTHSPTHSLTHSLTHPSPLHTTNAPLSITNVPCNVPLLNGHSLGPDYYKNNYDSVFS